MVNALNLLKCQKSTHFPIKMINDRAINLGADGNKRLLLSDLFATAGLQQGETLSNVPSSDQMPLSPDTPLS